MWGNHTYHQDVKKSTSSGATYSVAVVVTVGPVRTHDADNSASQNTRNRTGTTTIAQATTNWLLYVPLEQTVLQLLGLACGRQ